jgi:hypothetical protein
MKAFAASRKFAHRMIAAVTTLLLAAPILANAQGAPSMSDQTGLGATAGAAQLQLGAGLPTIVGNFIGAALGLLGVVFVVLLIYAGFLWLTAQGDVEKAKKAKGIIFQAVIGLVIIFSAYMITSFVISALGNSIGGTATPH